jgi:tetratricopeptide (TPR) repeat protein
LDSLVTYDLGDIHNGDYHLNVIKAISYDGLGETTKAITIMEEYMSKNKFYPMLYDYLLLGFFYLKQENYIEALEFFLKQKEVNDIAENEYYLAKTCALMDNKVDSKKWILSARDKYLVQNTMFDTYTEPYTKIYLSDIETLLEEVSSN